MPRHTYHPRIAEEMGRRIAYHRERMGLTKKQLANAVPGGLSETTIHRYELGEHGASLESLCLLALTFGCEPSELLPSLSELPAILGTT
ncbi:MAG: helix-turn-helix transcriptional regulator [Gammaproteobacteria bacterium]